jgi:hypothetical protein
LKGVGWQYEMLAQRLPDGNLAMPYELLAIVFFFSISDCLHAVFCVPRVGIWFLLVYVALIYQWLFLFCR